MFTKRSASKRAKDEGEKPFWISFSDLMSSLMVLFLVVMSVSLLAVSKTVAEAENKISETERKEAEDKKKKEEYATEIDRILSEMSVAAQKYRGISIDRVKHVIDFGDRARFDTNSSMLSSEQARYLRSFVPEILAIAQDELGKKWLKRIVVEGFADQRGDYLTNLNLSLQRSQRVICVLLEPPTTDERPLTNAQKVQIVDLFLVGGYSFNAAKKSMDESRRIEFRLEFYGIDEEHLPESNVSPDNFGACNI